MTGYNWYMLIVICEIYGWDLFVLLKGEVH